MADLPAFSSSLIEAGGWAVVVLIVTAILVGLWKKWWVPGFWHDEKDAALKAALLISDELRASNAELRVTNAQLRQDLKNERRRRVGDG